MKDFFALGFLGVIIGIVWAILCLILFFKVWGMTNDVRTIKYILLDILNSKDKNEVKQTEEPEYLEEGDVVVNIETGEELIVDQVFPDGDVTCKRGNGFGLRKVVKKTNLRKKETSES